jgi:hypothetical protein
MVMDKQLLPLRRLATAAGGVAAALALAACSAAAPGAVQGKTSLAAFRNDFVTFKYPQTWKPFVFSQSGGLHYNPILFLSTQPAHNSCRTTGTSTICGWPVGHLSANGVLVLWENRGYPGWTLRSAPGQSTRVGGRPAKRAVEKPGRCGAIGANETIAIAIARPLQYNWTAVTACIHDADLATANGKIDALLASTRFLRP